MPLKTQAGELTTLDDWLTTFRTLGIEKIEPPPCPVFVVDVPYGENDFDDQTSVQSQDSSPGLRVSDRPVEQHVVIPVVRKVYFADKPLFVGRASLCDTVIPFSSVSKVHAQLKASAGLWSMCDAGSTNGTRVGERVLQKSIWQALPDGAEVHFGSLGARFWLPWSFINSVLAAQR